MSKTINLKKIAVHILIMTFTLITVSLIVSNKSYVYAANQVDSSCIYKINTKKPIPYSSGYLYLKYNNNYTGTSGTYRIDVSWASTPANGKAAIDYTKQYINFSVTLVSGTDQGIVANGQGYTFIDKNGVLRRVYIPLHYTGSLNHYGLKDGSTWKNLGADEGGSGSTNFVTSSALNMRGVVNGTTDTNQSSGGAPHSWNGYFNLQVNINQCGLCTSKCNDGKYRSFVGTTKEVNMYRCGVANTMYYYDATTSTSADKSGITAWHIVGYRQVCAAYPNTNPLYDTGFNCDHQVITYAHSTYNVTLDKNDGTTITKSYTSQGKWTFNGNWTQSGNDFYASYTDNGEQSLTVDFGKIEQTGYTYGGIWSEDDDKGSANTIDASTGINVIYKDGDDPSFFVHKNSISYYFLTFRIYENKLIRYV